MYLIGKTGVGSLRLLLQSVMSTNDHFAKCDAPVQPVSGLGFCHSINLYVPVDLLGFDFAVFMYIV